MPEDPLTATTEASYYSALGVEPEATAEEIRRAFRGAILKHHPDRNNNSQESQTTTILLQEAYAVVGNVDKRAAYDRYLDLRKQEEERGRPDVHGWRFDPTGQTAAPRTADGAIIVETEPQKYVRRPLRTYWWTIPLLAATLLIVFAVTNYNAIPAPTIVPSVVPVNSGGIMPDTSKSAMDHISKGEILENDYDVDDAVDQYKSAVAQDPTSIDAHRHLAHALSDEGLYTPSQLEYETLIKLAPNDVEAHNGLAYVLVMRSQNAAAILELQTALKLDPKNVEAYKSLGSIYYNAQQYQLAADNFRNAVANAPTDTEAICNLANTLSDAGSYTESIDEYRSALQIDPNYTDAKLGLGKALYLSGQKLAGEVELTGVLKMNQPDTDRFMKDLVVENSSPVPLAH